MANPFFIQPASYGQGLGQLSQAVGQFGAQRKQDAAVEQQKAQRQQAMTQARELLTSGANPSEIAAFSLENPDVGKSLMGAISFKNDATKNNMMESMRSIATGQDPERVITNRINLINEQGGDPTQSMGELERYKQNPEQYVKNMENMYAVLDPKGSESLRKLRPEAKTQAQKPFEQGTGGLAGYSFDPNTGKFEKQVEGTGISPTIKPTANMQDWDEYKRLKKTDPEGAKSFGEKVGFVKPDGTELSVHLQKRLSNATDNAIKSEGNAESYRGLSTQFDKANVGGGLFQGSWGEEFKDITGQQDSITNLRKKYYGIRGSQVVNNLPPGAASDTDIKLALAGFPSDNATGKQISSFLKGLAKIEDQKAAFEMFKADYISDKGNEKGMVKAWREQINQKPLTDMTDEELLKSLEG